MLIGYDHETARRIELGLACAECDADFVKGSGFPVVCSFCKRRGSELPVSQHEEAQKVAHANAARKRRKAREST